MLLLDEFDVGGQIADFQLYQSLVAIHGTESISPYRHIPRAMVSNDVISLNDARDDLGRKLPAVPSAKLGEVR